MGKIHYMETPEQAKGVCELILPDGCSEDSLVCCCLECEKRLRCQGVCAEVGLGNVDRPATCCSYYPYLEI